MFTLVYLFMAIVAFSTGHWIMGALCLTASMLCNAEGA